MKPVTLSGRLQAVAAMVTDGSRVCDVGCDHGFVPIYLIEKGVSPAVLAMDVRSGPLNAAREHIAERGLETVIETRLSNGLHNYNIGEADTLICAGMGGRLMMTILSDDKTKTESFRELILQPQSEVEQFRAWLRNQGYRITEENMIEEDGKFYPMMRVEPGQEKQGAESYDYEEIYDRLRQRRASREDEPAQGMNFLAASSEVSASAPLSLFAASCGGVDPKRLNSACNYMDDTALCKLTDRYGPLLLLYGNRTLTAYLRREERIYEEILSGLRIQDLSNEKRKNRYEEVSQLLEECRMALDIVTSGETT